MQSPLECGTEIPGSVCHGVSYFVNKPEYLKSISNNLCPYSLRTEIQQPGSKRRTLDLEAIPITEKMIRFHIKYYLVVIIVVNYYRKDAFREA